MLKRALISVSDKTNIIQFAKQLQQFNIEILSTGGTAKQLKENNIPVIEVSDYTGSPEIMDGRVKTLHPKIHGGILGRRGEDDSIMAQQNIGPIDLVVVNLYPFSETIAKPQCDFATAIENIDIGGPTMIRAAAKNHAHVAVVVDNQDYDKIIAELTAQQGELSSNTRFYLAQKAFAHTAEYDSNIANYLGSFNQNGEHQHFPNTFSQQFIKQQDLRYGENPHGVTAEIKKQAASAVL